MIPPVPSGLPTRRGLRFLHLEDNLADAELVHAQLNEEWPGSAIQRVDTRDQFLTALQSADFNLILSDFSLPSFNGLEALTLVRQHGSATPFLFLCGTIGEENFAILRTEAVQVLRVSDAETVAAMRLVWSRLKQVVEPSCATVLAAVLRYPEHFAGKRVGLILSGGNVDLDALPW